MASTAAPRAQSWKSDTFVVAHESARQGGVRLEIPDFGDAPEA